MMNRSSLSLCFLLSAAAALTFLSCGSPDNKTTAAKTDSTVDAPFPAHPSTIRYAHGFSIVYHDQYKEVKIVNKAGDKYDTLHYLLVQRGTPRPAGYPGAQVITIPVRSLIVMSSMHIAQADFAGIADRITGVGDTKYLSSPLVRARIQGGKVKAVGIDANINNEQVISMHPDLLIAMTNPDATFSQYKTMIDAGVPVIPNAEWLETTPLGRAEWVKLMGALSNREEFVDQKFDSVDKSYQQLAAIGQKSATKPSVIIGMPYKGTWYTPAGASYMTKFLSDAGASYHWADTKGTGSLALNFETVAPVALKADYWLNVGYVNTKKDVTAIDNRFSGFAAFQKGNLFNFNKRVNDVGSNDYWESGAVNPQRVLSDLIKILHPEALPQDTLYYYKQMP